MRKLSAEEAKRLWQAIKTGRAPVGKVAIVEKGHVPAELRDGDRQ